METMRQYIISLSSVGLLAAALGCHHVAGVCDCEYFQKYGHVKKAAAEAVAEKGKEAANDGGQIMPKASDVPSKGLEGEASTGL